MTVDFDLPFAVHISSKPLNVDVEGVKCVLRFDKVQRDSVDPRLGIEGNFDLLEDRFGWVRYSKASISIPLSQPPPGLAGTRTEEWLVGIAISAVNVFLGHYRDVMNLSWIRPVSPIEVWGAEINYFQNGLTTRTVSYRPMHQLCLPIAGIGDEREQILRRRVQESHHPSQWKLLLLDAEEALNRGDARLAVILGQTAIEGAVSEGLVYTFHKRQLPLKDVRQKLQAGKALSYEEGVKKARASLLSKLTEGLNLANRTSIKNDLALWYDCDVANATRVACVHYGYFPSAKEARKVLNTYWRVYREYLEKLLPDQKTLETDYVGESINAVAQAFEQPLSKALSDIIREVVPILQKRLVLHHISSLPVHLDKEGTFGQAEAQGDLLLIWLDPGKGFDDNQAFIAETLIHFELLSKGYPYAKVAESLPFEQGRAGWEAIAETLTCAVLSLPINDRLRKAKFAVDTYAMERLEATRRRLSDPSYIEPRPNEARAKTVPLEVMRLYFSLESSMAKQELLNLVADRLANYTKGIRRLIEVIQKQGHSSQEECVQLMVECRNCLLLLDSCLVIDPQKRLVYYSSGPRSY